MVNRIIAGYRWDWPIANSPELIDLKRKTEWLPAPNSSSGDVLLWDKVKTEFSTKVVWNSLRVSHPPVRWSKVVWFKFHIPSHAFILWLAIRKKLATQDRLLSFGLIDTMHCPFCGLSREDHDHLFFSCSFTYRVWQSLLAISGLQDSSCDWDGVIQWASTICTGSTLISVIGKLSLAASVYVIWRERNRRQHEKQFQDEVTILTTIKELVRLRLMDCSSFPKTDQNHHLLHQWNLPYSPFKKESSLLCY